MEEIKKCKYCNSEIQRGIMCRTCYEKYKRVQTLCAICKRLKKIQRGGQNMTDKIKNMKISEAVELISDPEQARNLTWGEFVQIMDIVERGKRISLDQTGYSDFEKKLKKLESRVLHLEAIIGTIQSAFDGGEE